MKDDRLTDAADKRQSMMVSQLDEKPIYFAVCAACATTTASHENKYVAANIATAAGYSFDDEIGYVTCPGCYETAIKNSDLVFEPSGRHGVK
jgi:hypothetical protein